MIRISRRQTRSKQIVLSVALVLATAGLFFSLAARVTHAQQDRQLAQTGSATPAAAKRIALVIGNGAYTSAPPLKNPPNDAREMAATLKALGFDVTSGTNVNQRDMKRLIREFGMKLKGGGSGLFYYAGHGVQSKGRNYLIPVDANIQSEAEVEDSGVDAALVLNFMDDAQNGLNIVILDACRNNPFSRSFRSASDGLAQVDAPTGTLIAYATAPGRVASDGTGQNGLYTAELLKQMQVPGLTATEMFMRVRAEVMKQTGSKQVPWEASSLVGSFYFAGGPADSAAAPAINGTRVDPNAFELSYWETIKNSANADDFKAYLEKYPSGQFASLAKNRISSLHPEVKPPERSSPSGGGQAEITFWDSIKNSQSADDYRAYLEKYPEGDFAGLAKRRLAPLEANEKEKAKAEEVARNIKRFKGSYVLRGAMLNISSPGTMTVTPTSIQFVYDDVDQNKVNGKLNKPYPVACSDLTEARIDDVFVREIRDGKYRTRFQAESAAAAGEALAAMRYVCANPGKNFTDGLPAEAKDKPTAATPKEELLRQFVVRNGKSKLAAKGTLSISSSGIDFVEKDNPEKKKFAFSCADVSEATVPGFPYDKTFLRIRAGNDTHSFIANSTGEASTIVETVRLACKLNMDSKKR